MKRFRLIIWVVLLSLLIVSSISYANMAPPPIINTDELKVGTWAKILQQGNGMSMKVWFGIVGKENVGGKNYVWVEMRFKQGGQDFIVKSLMRISINEHVSDIKKMIFKIGNQPAMEIPLDMLKMMGQNAEFFSPSQGKENSTIEILGREKVKVPAGTFMAKHIRVKANDGSFTMDLWESNKVPVKIVKEKTSNGMEVTLLAYGKGAKTKITEKPVPFNMQNFIMNMNQR